MKSFITCAILLASMVLTSCATVFPVHNPDMNRDEYAGLIAAESERTVCYEKGFRGGMLFLDFVLGAPFLWTPLIFDAATGKYTAYYYHHNRCEKYKAEERHARYSQQYPQAKQEEVRTLSEPDPAYVAPVAPAASPSKPVESEPREETAKETDPAPVEKSPAVKEEPSVPIKEEAPAPVKEEDEYEDLY
jgi:hypothetical protein